MYVILKKRGVRFFTTVNKRRDRIEEPWFHSLKDAREWGFKHLGKTGNWVIVNSEDFTN